MEPSGLIKPPPSYVGGAIRVLVADALRDTSARILGEMPRVRCAGVLSSSQYLETTGFRRHILVHDFGCPGIWRRTGKVHFYASLKEKGITNV